MNFRNFGLAVLFVAFALNGNAQARKTLKEKSLEAAATGFLFSGSYIMQKFEPLNDYMKVVSDSFNFASPLHFADNCMSIGIGYAIKNPVVETELSVDYMRLSTDAINAAGTKSTMVNSAFTYGLGFNFFPVKCLFVGTNLSVSSHKLKSTFSVAGTDGDLAKRLLKDAEDMPFTGLSFGLRAQAGVFIPFSRKKLGSGLRIMPYYDLSTNYDFTKKVSGKKLQAYSGDTKMPGSAYGVKASLVILLRHYEKDSKVPVERQESRKEIAKLENKFSYIWYQVWHMTYPSNIYSIDYATVLSATELTNEEVMSLIKKPKIRIGMTSVKEAIEVCPSNGNCGSIIQSFANKYYPSTGAVDCGTYQH